MLNKDHPRAHKKLLSRDETVRALREQLGAERRKVALYGDTLRVISGYPRESDRGLTWCKKKALEALDKTESAARGEIYAQITWNEGE